MKSLKAKEIPYKQDSLAKMDFSHVPKTDAFKTFITQDAPNQTFLHKIIDLHCSEKEYPYPLDDVLNWIGYTAKHSLIDKISKVDNTNLASYRKTSIQTKGRQCIDYNFTFHGLYTVLKISSTKTAKHHLEVLNLLPALVMKFHMIQTGNTVSIIPNITNLSLHTEAPVPQRFQRDNSNNSVYICSDGSENNYKVGCTVNVKKRETGLRNGNCENAIVHYVHYDNHQALEKVVHELLTKFHKKDEWFTVDYEVAKSTLDCAHIFMKTFKSFPEQLVGFSEKLQKLFDDHLQDQSVQHQEIDNNEVSSVEDDEEAEPTEEDFKELKRQKVNVATDYDQFIKECCIIDERAFAFNQDLYGAHKLWGRVISRTVRNGFIDYLRSKFHGTKVVDPVSGATLSAKKGLKLKPLMWKRSDPPNEYDQFVEEVCDLSYTGRVSSKELADAYTKWKRQKNPDFDFNAAREKKLHLYLAQQLVRSHVNSSADDHAYGFFGMYLKTADQNMGKKMNEKRKKPVIKVHKETKEIRQDWPSLSEAARDMEMSPILLSNYIRQRKPIGDYFYLYKNEIEQT